MAAARPFMIDGTLIPTPDAYKFNIADLSTKESGRVQTGTMYKDVVAVKDTYECTWKALSWAELAALLALVDGKESFRFTYADPRYPNQWRTEDFYAGDRTGGALNLNDSYNSWSDITIKFIRR